MKSIKSDKNCEEVKFPCLMKGNSSESVVLMTKIKVGTVVNVGRDHYLGEFRDDWSMRSFTPYSGSVCLEN